MTFSRFMEFFTTHFKWMLERCDCLFDTSADPDMLWALYLDSFPAEANTFFRKRREFDCSCCRRFIRQFGRVVGVVESQMVSIWDFETGDAVYQPVIDALSNYVKSFPISEMHLETRQRVGVVRNFEIGADGNPIEWNHFYVTLPNSFVTSRDDVEYLQAEVRDNHQVFKRSMDEFTLKAIDTIQELIASNSLYRGEEWATSLSRFWRFKVAYESLPIEQRDNWCWVTATRYSSVSLRIRNLPIGVLLADISNGVALDAAVRKYEAIMAPANYKRPKAIFTKKMVEDAQRTITELGNIGGSRDWCDQACYED